MENWDAHSMVIRDRQGLVNKGTGRGWLTKILKATN